MGTSQEGRTWTPRWFVDGGPGLVTCACDISPKGHFLPKGQGPPCGLERSRVCGNPSPPQFKRPRHEQQPRSQATGGAPCTTRVWSRQRPGWGSVSEEMRLESKHCVLFYLGRKLRGAASPDARPPPALCHLPQDQGAPALGGRGQGARPPLSAAAQEGLRVRCVPARDPAVRLPRLCRVRPMRRPRVFK